MGGMVAVTLHTTTNESHILYNYHPHIWYDNLEGFRSTSELRDQEVQRDKELQR